MSISESDAYDRAAACVLRQVVERYTEATGTDWDDDDRCSTCSSSSSDSQFDYYLDRRLRPTQPAPRLRHVGEDFVYASGSAAFCSPARCVRSPSTGRVVAATTGWPRDAASARRGRRRRSQTGTRCVVS